MDEEFQQTLGRWPAGVKGDWQRWVLLREDDSQGGEEDELSHRALGRHGSEQHHTDNTACLPTDLKRSLSPQAPPVPTELPELILIPKCEWAATVQTSEISLGPLPLAQSHLYLRDH